MGVLQSGDELCLINFNNPTVPIFSALPLTTVIGRGLGLFEFYYVIEFAICCAFGRRTCIN